MHVHVHDIVSPPWISIITQAFYISICSVSNTEINEYGQVMRGERYDFENAKLFKVNGAEINAMGDAPAYAAIRLDDVNLLYFLRYFGARLLSSDSKEAILSAWQYHSRETIKFIMTKIHKNNMSRLVWLHGNTPIYKDLAEINASVVAGGNGLEALDLPWTSLYLHTVPNIYCRPRRRVVEQRDEAASGAEPVAVAIAERQPQSLQQRVGDAATCIRNFLASSGTWVVVVGFGLRSVRASCLPVSTLPSPGAGRAVSYAICVGAVAVPLSVVLSNGGRRSNRRKSLDDKQERSTSSRHRGGVPPMASVHAAYTDSPPFYYDGAVIPTPPSALHHHYNDDCPPSASPGGSPSAAGCNARRYHHHRDRR